MPAANDFHQLRLQFIDPVQHDYEVIRPVVLLAETVAARSEETAIPPSTIRDKARRFVRKGMVGLVDQRTISPSTSPHEYPRAVADYILFLKHLYPPLHCREIVRILAAKLGYHTNHHTVKRFLDQHPIPIQLELALPRFHDFEDAYQARWTVVRMHAEGWNKKSIAGCLKLSRKHVYHILDAFDRDDFAGLETCSTRPPDHASNQLTLPFMKEVLALQHAYPRLGQFRLHGLLRAQRDEKIPSERTVGRAMALNRQHHGAPGPWVRHESGTLGPQPRWLPYRPRYRHHYWFIDIRYLVKLDEGWVYSICIIEGFSRKILAGMASPYQDVTAILQLLLAALAEYGCPEALVSDNGSVFKAADYHAILRALRVQPTYIAKGRPWENLIEAQFKVQLRLADVQFEEAQTLQEVQDLRAAFIQTFNTTPH